MKNFILLVITIFFATGALAQTKQEETKTEQEKARDALVKSIKEDVKNNQSTLHPKKAQSSGSTEGDYNRQGISGETYERFGNLKLSKSPELERSSRSSSGSSRASGTSGSTTRRTVTRSSNSSRVGGAARVRVSYSGRMSDEERAARREAAEARRQAELEAAHRDAEVRSEFMNTITTDNLRKIAVYSDPANRPKLSAEGIKLQTRGFSGNYIEEDSTLWKIREPIDVRSGINNVRSGEELLQIYETTPQELTDEEILRLNSWLEQEIARMKYEKAEVNNVESLK